MVAAESPTWSKVKVIIVRVALVPLTPNIRSTLGMHSKCLNIYHEGGRSRPILLSAVLDVRHAYSHDPPITSAQSAACRTLLAPEIELNAHRV